MATYKNDYSNSKQKKSDLHKHHRQRLKKRFRDCGLDGFYGHNVLELLLFYSIPRRDTNEIAHELINHFGSFSNVLEASVEDLMEVPGVGLESATLLTLLPDVFSFYLSDKARQKKSINTPEDAIEALTPYYVKMDVEKFVIIYLDGASEIINIKEFSQGSTSRVFVDPSVIIREALTLRAKGIILSHCHCDGFCNPSDSDVFLTVAFYEVCNKFSIALCDHIIFAEKGIEIMCRSKHRNKISFAFT